MAAMAPDVVVAQGPQNDNVAAARTSIPLAGFAYVDPLLPTLVAVAEEYINPVPSESPTVAALLTYTSFDDWYYRIHIVPQVINFGNLSGSRTMPVLVWNAFFTEVELQDFAMSAVEGLTVEEPVSPPVDVGPLRTLTYVITAEASGPPVISATATWTIDGVDYVVPITGRRSVLFSFRPNWRASPYRETYSWATTVNRSWSGHEQRFKISQAIRRLISYAALVLKSIDRQRLDSMLFSWQGRTFGVPLWNEAEPLSAPVSAGSNTIQVDTTNMTLKEGATIVLFLRQGVVESLEVESFDSDSITVTSVAAANWPLGTRVVPAAPAIPPVNTNLQRPVPEYMAMPVTFLIDPASQMTGVRESSPEFTYRGEEAYFVETDWAVDLDGDIEQNRRETDSGLGVIAMIPKGDFAFTGRSFRWLVKTKAGGRTLLDFFCRRQGRFSPVWMPSGADDFTLAAPIGSSDSSITVLDNDYASLLAQVTARRDIVLLLRDGRRLCRRIVDSAADAGTLVLNLDSTFGEAISLTQVKRISYLGLYRLSSDSVTFNWLTDRVATVETDFILTEPDE